MTNKLRLFQNLLALSAVSLIIIVWSTVTYLALNNRKLQSTTSQITTYEECVGAGNTVLESYPAVCVTRDGKKFFQKINNNQTIGAENWVSYKNDQYGFSVKYPPNMFIDTSFVHKSDKGIVLKYTDNRAKKYPSENGGSLIVEPVISVQFLTKSENYDQFINSRNPYQNSKYCGETVIYQKTILNGLPAYYFEHAESDSPCNWISYLITIDSNVYALSANSYDISPEFRALFNQILSTFRFTENEMSSVKPTGTEYPVAGICGNIIPNSTLTITRGVDYIYSPRCSKVSSNQKLKIVNNSDQMIPIETGEYYLEIKPGESYLFPEMVGSFLGSGVHLIGGAEIWLQE